MVGGILGEKMGMTQLFTQEGRIIPVTVISAGPCQVVQIKKKERDGYDACQLSYKETKEGKLSKAMRGHFAAATARPARVVREVRGGPDGIEIGQMITVEIFQKGEKVDVVGLSKGKGFAGVVKRHHFRGGPATHGSMFHRTPGSIGSSSFPSRVIKGKRMAGRLGNETTTIKTLEVVDIRKDDNLLFLKGAVPGSPGGLLIIRKQTG